MAGLSMRVAGYGGAATGGSGAAVPVAANNPSSTISQQAFGITAGTAGPSNAANGALASGALAAALLTWLWWTLPR